MNYQFDFLTYVQNVKKCNSIKQTTNYNNLEIVLMSQTKNEMKAIFEYFHAKQELELCEIPKDSTLKQPYMNALYGFFQRKHCINIDLSLEEVFSAVQQTVEPIQLHPIQKSLSQEYISCVDMILSGPSQEDMLQMFSSIEWKEEFCRSLGIEQTKQSIYDGEFTQRKKAKFPK